LTIILCDECHDEIEARLEILEGNRKGRKIRNKRAAYTYIRHTEKWLGEKLVLPEMFQTNIKKPRKQKTQHAEIASA
jgi:hypothetical protein